MRERSISDYTYCMTNTPTHTVLYQHNPNSAQDKTGVGTLSHLRGQTCRG